MRLSLKSSKGEILDKEAEEEIYLHLSKNLDVSLTCAQIARCIGKFPMAIKPALDRMVEAGRIVYVDIDGTAKYSLMEEAEKNGVSLPKIVAEFKPLSQEYIDSIAWAMGKRT